MVQGMIFIDSGCLLSFIYQTFRFHQDYSVPKVAPMKINIKVR
jgi:hypothetical protein